MTKVFFLDNTTINVEARDGEIYTLRPYAPVQGKDQREIVKQLEHYFDKHVDSASPVYWVLMEMWGYFAFYCETSDQKKERERIGQKIRQLREEKGIEARHLAVMANIDAANLSRIENGKYSVGFDILSKIANVLGAKVDLV